MNPKEILKVAVVLFATAYAFNLIWEVFHSLLYNLKDFYGISRYIVILMRAGLGDATIILLMYTGIAILSKDFLWLKKPSKNQIILISLVGLIIAAWIEYKALYMINSWEYNEMMPTIFTIGLTPLIQLSLTALISNWLTRRLIYKI